MPKEPKKFINPLLRPSTTTEQKERLEEKPTRKSVAAKASSPSDESSVGSVSISSPQDTAVQEGRIVEQVGASPARSTRRSSSSVVIEEPEDKAATKTPMASPTSSETETITETYTSTSRIENTLPEETLSGTAGTVPAPRNQLSSEASIQDTPVQSPPLYRNQVEPQNYIEALPQREDNIAITGALSSYASTETSIRSAPLPAPVIDEQHTGELLDATEFTALGSVRRRRGAQTFEKTHERITLWIDKRLKQAFDELAYEQELPKTALLNEAIADLLRKYRAR